MARESSVFVKSIRKWGNSFVISIPSEIVEALQLRPGEKVKVTIEKTEEEHEETKEHSGVEGNN